MPILLIFSLLISRRNVDKYKVRRAAYFPHSRRYVTSIAYRQQHSSHSHCHAAFYNALHHWRVLLRHKYHQKRAYRFRHFPFCYYAFHVVISRQVKMMSIASAPPTPTTEIEVTDVDITTHRQSAMSMPRRRLFQQTTWSPRRLPPPPAIRACPAAFYHTKMPRRAFTLLPCLTRALTLRYRRLLPRPGRAIMHKCSFATDGRDNVALRADSAATRLLLFYISIAAYAADAERGRAGRASDYLEGFRHAPLRSPHIVITIARTLPSFHYRHVAPPIRLHHSILIAMPPGQASFSRDAICHGKWRHEKGDDSASGLLHATHDEISISRYARSGGVLI